MHAFARPLGTTIFLAVLVGLLMPAVPASATSTYARNLYDSRAVRWQDPDYTACTASSALQMLNMVAYRGSKGSGFRWTPTTSYAKQETMLRFERSHDTLVSGEVGSDPHGWRNALNAYGWGTTAMLRRSFYDDRSYSSYDAAVHAAVRAIARYGKPVGISGWAGGHAQIMTGYVVTGADPAISDGFAVQSIFLTDPLRKDGLRNARITNTAFRSGSLRYRFRAYGWKDSPYDDPYTSGIRASWREWYGRWVIVVPVR
jgi:hypothetical protein